MRMGARKSWRLVYLSGILILLASLSSWAQTGVRDNKVDTSCESGLLKFDTSLLKLKENPETVLILIAYRAKNEKNNVRKARLTALRRILSIRKASGEVIFAESEKLSDIGSIKIFIAGKLFDTIYYDRNTKTFCDKP